VRHSRLLGLTDAMTRDTRSDTYFSRSPFSLHSYTQLILMESLTCSFGTCTRELNTAIDKTKNGKWFKYCSKCREHNRTREYIF
jgi:hypothetical protein